MIPKRHTKSRPFRIDETVLGRIAARRQDPIGVFDSGVGGLSVLRELKRLLPNERFVFLADQINVPYGGKTGPQLCSLTSRITLFLLKHRCKLVVVACNTATCYAIEHLRASFAVPFIGTVPAIKPAVALTRTGVIGSISTPATAKSPALKKLVRQYADSVRTIISGCPGLEELVEAGGIHGPAPRVLLARYLKPIIAAGADVLVLGCTHYPFLKRTIRSVAPSLRTVDSGHAIARYTRTVLASASLLSSRKHGTDAFYTTANASRMSSVSSQLLRRPIRARHVRI